MWSRIVRPPRSLSVLSPPPMRRDRPPASNSPTTPVAAPLLLAVLFAVIVAAPLAPMAGWLVGAFAGRQIEVDTFFPRQRHEAPPACPADQRQSRLPSQIHTPGGETAARHQDRNTHLYRLDHHLRGEASCRIEDLVFRRQPVP